LLAVTMNADQTVAY